MRILFEQSTRGPMGVHHLVGHIIHRIALQYWIGFASSQGISTLPQWDVGHQAPWFLGKSGGSLVPERQQYSVKTLIITLEPFPFCFSLQGNLIILNGQLLIIIDVSLCGLDGSWLSCVSFLRASTSFASNFGLTNGSLGQNVERLICCRLFMDNWP